MAQFLLLLLTISTVLALKDPSSVRKCWYRPDIAKVIVGLSIWSSWIHPTVAETESTAIIRTDDMEDSETRTLKLIRRGRYDPDSETSSVTKFSLEKLNKLPAVPYMREVDVLTDSQSRVLTLKAYLDEAERDLFLKNWNKLIVYLNIFAEQEAAFANLITGIFPSSNDLDKVSTLYLCNLIHSTLQLIDGKGGDDLRGSNNVSCNR